MDLSHIPNEPGVYLMRDASGVVIYVGKAKDLKKRTSQYFRMHTSDTREMLPNLLAVIRSIDYIPAASEREALLIERQLIYKLQPFFNAMWKDSKTYPYVELTNEDFPRVFFTRRKLHDKGFYFGPYPKVEPIKKLLAYLRRIKFINLRRCKWKFNEKEPLIEKKIKLCLYYHTGQCTAPCAGKISKREYSLLAERVKDFFKGNYEKLINEFKEKMLKASQETRYEDAALYRDFLAAFDFMRERVRINRLPENYVETATAKSNAVTELQKLLKLKYPPVHIECFDTSHTFGKQAVGSSVCFTNAQRNTEHYRKYKIKYENTPSGGNDFAMIEEIVFRRLKQIKNSDDCIPDLLLIDGGAGQLSSAQTAMRRAKLHIPVISIAKKLEEIYVAGKEEPILADRSNKGLQLLQALRDEAHRFGITFHRSLRAKNEVQKE